MSDIGSDTTDLELKRLEKRIIKVYSEARKDILKKMYDFNERYKVKEAKYAQQVKDGIITQKDFDAWKRGQVFQGEQWKSKKLSIENTLHNSNVIAQNMINGKTNGIFATNVNYMSYSLETGQGVNFGFNLYDETTVADLIKHEPDLLPKPRVNKYKDNQWNSKKITAQITQGIIQGESLDQIAERLARTTSNSNKNSMLTHARTALTGAQNSGRLHSLNNARNKGINVKKEWIATLDERTRTTHAELDGQSVDISSPFQVDGYSIMYPGDPHAHPAMVYNCRCALGGDVVDYPSEYERYDNIEGKPIKGMTYREWEKAKSNKKISLNDITIVHRPKREDFSSDESYDRARDIYREMRKERDKQMQTYIDEYQYPNPMSIKEFGEWCNNKGIKIYNDITPVDKRCLRAFANRMDKLTKDFPEVLTYRDKIERGIKFEVSFTDTHDYMAEATHGFDFGADFKNFDNALLSYIYGVVREEELTIGDGTLNKIFDHEFGHNVYDMLKYRGDTRYRVNLMQDVINSLGGKSGCSEYSNINDDELFAEAFSSWYGGENTEFARAMGEFLKKYGVIK